MKRLLLLNYLFFALLASIEAQQFSILSYNIYHGESPVSPRKPTLDSIAAYIRQIQPEAVAFQELDSMTRRSERVYGEKIDLLDQLGHKTGLSGYFGRSILFDEGAYGNGILAKNSKDYHTFPLPSPAGGEQRAVVWSKLELSNQKEIYLGSVHLDHEYEQNRVAQIDSLLSYATSLSRPAVIVGDFNFEEGSEAYNRVPEHWKDAGKEVGKREATFPGEDGKRIDYLFYDSNFFKLVSYQLVPLPYSDHYAILVTLDLLK